jgi:hypothetical protein
VERDDLIQDIFRDNDKVGYYDYNDYNNKKMNCIDRAICPKVFNSY